MQRDILFVACTRPAVTRSGLPGSCVFIISVGSWLGYMFISGSDPRHGGYLWGAVWFLLYDGMKWLMAKDPYAFRMLKCSLSIFSFSSTLWGSPKQRRWRKRMSSAL